MRRERKGLGMVLVWPEPKPKQPKRGSYKRNRYDNFLSVALSPPRFYDPVVTAPTRQKVKRFKPWSEK